MHGVLGLRQIVVGLEQAMPIGGEAKHRTTKHDRLKQWSTDHVFNHPRQAGALEQLSCLSNLARILLTQPLAAAGHAAVVLAHRTGPDEVVGCSDLAFVHQESVGLNELVAAVPGLCMQIHTSNMKPSLLQSASRTSSAAK